MIPVEFDQSIFLSLIIWSAVIGIFLGAVYDIFRIRRIAFSQKTRLKTEVVKKSNDVGKQKCRKTGVRVFFIKNIEVIDNILIFFEDIIFMIFSAIVISLLTYKLNCGKIRWFMFVAVAIGFAAYYCTIGKIVKKCAESIIRYIRLFIWWIIKITIMPILKLISKLFEISKNKIRYKHSVIYTRSRERKIFTLVTDGIKDNEENDVEKADSAS